MLGARYELTPGCPTLTVTAPPGSATDTHTHVQSVTGTWCHPVPTPIFRDVSFQTTITALILQVL
eukprot:4565947-Amphidinium_carterae.1